MSLENAHNYMKEALEQARLAASQGEVPVGAVIVYEGDIIARSHNEVEQIGDATRHAECLAISRASKKLESWRLQGAALFVTLEPCTMCLGAIELSRISELYFGCYDDKFGAVGSRYDLSLYGSNKKRLNVYPECLAEECAQALSQFFSNLR